jgi:hypothetical protein
MPATLVQSHLAARAQFKALLLANPNHFGTVKKAPLPAGLVISGDTAFEQLDDVGYQPQLGCLEGIVTIKQGEGYGGGLCSAGSTEYVRFYTSADGGTTWVDQGLTSIGVHDLGGAAQPVQYAVSLQVDLPEQYCTSGANLPLVRAILSWSAPPPPAQPDFPPIWGNVVNTQIQVESVKLLPVSVIAEHVQADKAFAPLLASLDPAQTLTVAPAPLSAAALQALYKGSVPPHRFALAELHALSASPATLSSAKSVETLTGVTLAGGAVLAALAPASGSVQYEQLTAVGLNTGLSRLEAVVHIKLPNGYSGGLCTAGSTEYVAFWADEDGSGAFSTYLGTAGVGVYDIATLPAGGLDYAVFLPVDLSQLQKPCDQGPVLLPVRATLSWQVPPTPTDSGYVPTWGNTLQVTVQVASGAVVGTDLQPEIWAVGDVAINDIGVPSLGLATGSTIQTGLALSSSPWGGEITIAGKILNGTGTTRYRLMGKPHAEPDSAYAPITAGPSGLTLEVWTPPFGVSNVVSRADANGYYVYQDANNTVLDSLLMRWSSTAADDGGTFDLRLDVSVDGDPAHDVSSNVETVTIDNTAPAVTLTVTTPNGQLCPDVTPGGTITGTFSATDTNFADISWGILPDLPPGLGAPGGFAITTVGALTAIGYPSGTYAIATNSEPPCGYALELVASDRTNVNSGGGYHTSAASIGFCIMPAGTILGA